MDTRLTLQRLKSIQGHVGGVIRMVEEGAESLEIVRQILALEGALEKLNLRILEDHLQTCVREALEAGHDVNDRERAVREIIAVFQNTQNP